ncbi:MAG: EAL domain-containing protein [Actinomycetota bacterium]|nr:EAL domain-containing protein [Actinomycetota bacterium]
MNLASGEIVAVEALLRWAHPERGEVAPADFMAVAEATGLIVPIGGWVLSAACPQLAEWRQTLALPLPLRVTVNVSPRQLAAPGFVDFVRETLDVTVLPPAQIELEITESMIVAEDRGVANAVRELRALGVSVAVDDFVPRTRRSRTSVDSRWTASSWTGPSSPNSEVAARGQPLLRPRSWVPPLPWPTPSV